MAATPCERHARGSQFSGATTCRGASALPTWCGGPVRCLICPYGSPPTHRAESAVLRPTCPSWPATPKGCAPASRGPGTAGGTQPASGGPALAHCTPSPGMGKPYITQFSEHTLSPESFQLPGRTSPLRCRPKSAPRERRGPGRGAEPSSRYGRRTPAPASHTSPVAPLPFTPRHSTPSSGLN